MNSCGRNILELQAVFKTPCHPVMLKRRSSTVSPSCHIRITSADFGATSFVDFFGAASRAVWCVSLGLSLGRNLRLGLGRSSIIIIVISEKQHII